MNIIMIINKLYFHLVKKIQSKYYVFMVSKYETLTDEEISSFQQWTNIFWEFLFNVFIVLYACSRENRHYS
jgi:hypothetical protein